MKKTTGIFLLLTLSFAIVSFAKNYYQKMLTSHTSEYKGCQDYSYCQDILYKDFKKQNALNLYSEALRLSFERSEEKHKLAKHYEECASILVNGCSKWSVNNHTFQ